MRSLMSVLAVLAGHCVASPAHARAADDPFAEGSTWEGTRMIGKPGQRKVKQEFSITVTKRTKDEFEGEMVIPTSGDGKEFKVTITGTAPVKGDGAVKFKSEKKGDFRQEFTGKLRGGTIGGEFTGTDVYGKKIEVKEVKLDPKR